MPSRAYSGPHMLRETFVHIPGVGYRTEERLWRSGIHTWDDFSSVRRPPRIGGRLEVFAAGRYMWIPFAHVASVRMTAPKRLRDLLWPSAVVRAGAGQRDLELGEVLLPALTPLAWRHSDGAVRLGRVTEWTALDDHTEVPIGQKLWLVDGDEFPFLELRELDIAPAAPAAG